jgi:hypothetical protein
MHSLPPPKLEKLVGCLLPPACREEVLGDLCEGYESPARYLANALCVIPFVIASRIRRTVDPQELLVAAMLAYGSMLAAAWWLDRPFLDSQWGLLKLFLPSVQTLIFGMFEAAWQKASAWNLRWLANLVNTAVNVLIVFRTIPPSVLIYGSLAFLLLYSAFQLLLPPPLPGMQPVGARSVSPSVLPGAAARGVIGFVSVVVLSAIMLTSAGIKPGLVSIIVFLEAIVLGSLRKG